MSRARRRRRYRQRRLRRKTFASELRRFTFWAICEKHIGLLAERHGDNPRPTTWAEADALALSRLV